MHICTLLWYGTYVTVLYVQMYCTILRNCTFVIICTGGSFISDCHKISWQKSVGVYRIDKIPAQLRAIHRLSWNIVKSVKIDSFGPGTSFRGGHAPWIWNIVNCFWFCTHNLVFFHILPPPPRKSVKILLPLIKAEMTSLFLTTVFMVVTDKSSSQTGCTRPGS